VLVAICGSGARETWLTCRWMIKAARRTKAT
jgi:hypothetical protein